MAEEKGKHSVAEWAIAIVIFVAAMALFASAIALPLWWVAAMTLKALHVSYDAKLLLVPAYAVAVVALFNIKTGE